ncbi:MAG: hypothetical protein ACRD3G_11385 [Vicinamibacterales bacterium]
MPDRVKVYNLEEGGVQLVKSDQHMADNEFRAAQNAEFGDDRSGGGIETRGGMEKVNSEAMDGAILGFIDAPLVDQRSGSGVGIARLHLGTAQLDALNATPLILVPAPGPGIFIMPIQLSCRGRRGATAWTAGPQLQVVYEGLTVTLLDTLALDFFTAVNGTPQDKLYTVNRVNNMTHTANTQLANLGLRLRLGADTNPGDAATLDVNLLYQVVHGIYDED